jgi:CHAT domain-containing protein
MRQLLISSFFFVFSCLSTYAQGVYTLADTTVAQRLMKEGSTFIDNRKYDSADIKVDSAYAIFEKTLGKETKEIADVIDLKGRVLKNKRKTDLAYTEFEKSLAIRLKIFGEMHPSVASSYDNIGFCFDDKGEYRKSIEFYQKGLDIKLKTLEPNHKSIGASMNNFSSSYSFLSDYEKSLNYAEKALNIYSKSLSENDPAFVALYNSIGIIYLRKAEYDRSIEFFIKAQNICLKIGEKMYPNLSSIYSNIAGDYMYKEDYDKALEFSEKALAIKLKLYGEMSPTAAVSIGNIGSILRLRAEYDKALKYTQKALNIKLKVLEPEHPDIANNINDIANIYSDIGEDDKTIQYNLKALYILLKKFGESHPAVASTYSSLSKAHKNVGNFDKSIEYAQKSYDIRLEKFGSKNAIIPASLSTIGDIYYAKKEYQKSIEYYQKAIDLTKSDEQNQEFAQHLNKIGNAYVFQNDFEKALDAYQKAAIIFKNREKHDRSSYAKTLNYLAQLHIKKQDFSAAETLLDESILAAKFQKSDFNTNLVLVNILATKGHLKLMQYQENQDIQVLNQSLKNYNEAIITINYRNKTFTTEKAITEYKNKQHDVYEGALKAITQLSMVDKSRQLFNQAFEYNEQIKAGLLQAQLKESDALAYSNIPDSLLKKESMLRTGIAWRDKQRQEKLMTAKSESDSTVLTISSTLFDLHQDYETLKQNLEKNYPEYYRLKYDTKTVSEEDVQKKLLSPRQTLLSYFVGDSSIFAFVVKLDTFAVYTIKKDFPIEMYVKQLRDGLYGYQTAAVKTEKLYEAKADSFAQAAFQLHQKLIGPLSILLTKEVILVPDGVLGYIPFDVLLSEKPKDATKFKSHHYFGKDHIISYNYSATLWQEMQNKKHKTEPTKNFVGYAPYYNGDTTVLSQIFANDLTMRKGLDSLKYSGEEVFKAQKLMGGESVLDKKATKKTFEETASNYRIIHLATHGKANDKAGDYCFLAFTEQKDSIDNELLYVRDIYNLSLNADLVVLSACETGIGELKRGEGIVSLARAFAYSGAKSMVTSLWSVNDKSTMQIMENFYRNLRKGQTKNYALWKAKQDYWEKAKGEFAHPFYWSSFIPIGDMKPVKMLP